MPDQKRNCVRCGEPFVWTASAQRDYRERGFDPPKRCPACRGKGPDRRPAAPGRNQITAPAQTSARQLLQAQAGPPARRRSTPQRTFALVTLLLAAVGAGALVLFADIPVFYAWVLAVSATAFITYGYDKGIAGSSVTRAPEHTLILLAAVGGTLGAMLGMLVFRHKTGQQTADFRGRLFAVIAVQAIAGVAWLLVTQR